MDKSDSYDNLNFQRQPRRMNSQLMATGLIIAAFTFLWWIIPPSDLYWVLLLPLVGLAWSANYGYRSALSDLIKALQKLEQR
jgi:hypothetical protein